MINTIVLKVASPCNLACTYCYEYNHGDDTWKKKPKRIPLLVAERLAKNIQTYIDENQINHFNVVSHGGEPLLLGPKYLSKLYKVFSDNLDTNKVKFSMQTNATLINDEFVEIFKSNNIFLGISLDGDINANKMRIDHKGKETWHRTVKGISIIQEKSKNLLSGILSVVNFNSDPLKVLECFHEMNINMVDFLLPFYTHDSLNLLEKKKIQSILLILYKKKIK